MQIAALFFVVKELSWSFWSIKCVRAEVLAELAPLVSSFVLHSTFNSTNRANSSPTVKAAQGTLLINPRTEKLSLVRNTQVRRASVKPRATGHVPFRLLLFCASHHRSDVPHDFEPPHDLASLNL